MDSVMHVDKQALNRLEKVGGADLLVRVIDQFIASSQARLDAACDSGKSGHLESVGRALKALKEGAQNLGALDVRDLAGHIERLAVRGAKDLILPLLCQLDGMLQQTEQWLLSERRERMQPKGTGQP